MVPHPATSFVCLVLLFVYGTWFGLVLQRWDTIGLLAALAGALCAGGFALIRGVAV